MERGRSGKKKAKVSKLIFMGSQKLLFTTPPHKALSAIAVCSCKTESPAC